MASCAPKREVGALGGRRRYVVACHLLCGIVSRLTDIPTVASCRVELTAKRNKEINIQSQELKMTQAEQQKTKSLLLTKRQRVPGLPNERFLI